MAEQWFAKGALVGACNCDWGCPCNFDARPTMGFCDGGYSIVVREGRFGAVPLDGAVFVMLGHSPGAIHEGNGTALLILDEALSPPQRDAIVTLWRGEAGGPFAIFASVTSTWLEPVVAPIEVHLDGIRSRVRVAGGVWDLAISRVRNPVTGEEEEIYLDKPSGFTSLRSELGMSEAMRLSTPDLSYDHTGKYAEYAEFEYEGP